MSEVKTPWKDYMGDVPMHLDYFQGSMFEAVERMAELYPNNIAFDFMGKSTTYKKMVQEIEKCAKSLKTLGVRPGDKVTIAMPNCPQAIYMFYAVNLVGGIANMIHPLSAEKEIEFYLNESESVTAITLDQFYNKFESVRKNTKVVNIIIASIKDALAQPIKAGYMLTQGRKIEKIPEDAPVIRWQEFVRMSRYCFYDYKISRTADDPAVILYSGGTTGTTKGIVLTNLNFTYCHAIRASGFSRKSMTIVFAGVIANIILDPIFIFGFAGIPAMGIAGAAWATVLSQAFAATVMLLILHFRYRFLTFVALQWRFLKNTWLMITRFAIPSMFGMLLMPIGNGGVTWVLPVRRRSGRRLRCRGTP